MEIERKNNEDDNVSCSTTDDNKIEIPEPTKESSKTIRAIDQDTVQKICSGQVIISLAIAVKELVENSLDAGATIIEVRLKEYGLESIEVIDNGYGVKEEDLNGMTSRYSTSKIEDFSDLQFVETFGFRGEALNSLCALSDMTIVTRHQSTNIGTKLELDHRGLIKNKTPHPRQIGTTVTMTNLFATLPVRKKDYTKNIKKEFSRMCQILQAYCLISKNVRILCSNQTSKSGGRSIFMTTRGSPNVSDNIQSVFGSKQLSDLIEIKSPLEDENEKFTKDNLLELLNETTSSSSSKKIFDITDDDVEKLNRITFKIEGWISSCTHGCGRSSRDRQYFYINSRPCEPKNIIKLVNEVYHRYNNHQYPFVFLNISLERTEIDVNLTPDKRMLLLSNEKLLLLIIKKSLLRTFGNIASTYKIQNTKLDLLLKQCDERNITEVDSDDEITLKPNSQKFKENLMQWKATGTTDGPYKPVKCIKRKQDSEIEQLNKKIKSIQNILSQGIPSPSSLKSSKINEEKKVELNRESFKYLSESDDSNDKDTKTSKIEDNISSSSLLESQSSKDLENDEFDEMNQPSCSFSKHYNENRKAQNDSQPGSDDDVLVKRIDCKIKEFKMESPKLIVERIPGSTSSIHVIEDMNDVESTKINKNRESSDGDDNDDIEEMIPTQLTTVLDSSDDDVDVDCNRMNKNLSASKEIDITIDDIRKLALREEEIREEKEKLKGEEYNKKIIIKFKSEINPDKSKKAEEELEREITKDMFKKMDIIGQFNLGFIIVKLDDDLFIIDQHASDEKYNFETLQKTTVLQYQPLAVPQNLELTAVNEMILIDNLKVFEANGFRFQIDENAPVTKKVRLIGKPFSRNWGFDKSDIEELIFMLQDAPEGTMCRPSRIRNMFASRACRKSVMIGKALNHRIMRKLVNHMGEIEHPWNCPHGRPTMRHLVNLNMLVDEES